MYLTCSNRMALEGSWETWRTTATSTTHASASKEGEKKDQVFHIIDNDICSDQQNEYGCISTSPWDRLHFMCRAMSNHKRMHIVFPIYLILLWQNRKGVMELWSTLYQVRWFRSMLLGLRFYINTIRYLIRKIGKTGIPLQCHKCTIYDPRLPTVLWMCRLANCGPMTHICISELKQTLTHPWFVARSMTKPRSESMLKSIFILHIAANKKPTLSGIWFVNI